MEINFCEQGTEAWFAARRGMATASEFNKLITSTGKASTQRTAYLHKIAADVLTGKSESHDNEWMQRGRELEAEAVALYEFETGSTAYSVGLISHADVQAACSPDSLVEDGHELGGLEVKCPAPHTHVKYVIGGKVPTDYFHQVQGSMWVSGLPWWDFMSYHPDMRPLIVRATPDADYFAALDKALPKFAADLQAVLDTMRNR